MKNRVIIWTNTGKNITIRRVESVEFVNDTLFIQHVGYSKDKGTSSFKIGGMWAGWTEYIGKEIKEK